MNNKKKILIYQNGTSGGGSKRSLYEIVRVLLNAQYEVRIVCTNRGWFSNQLDHGNIAYDFIPGFELLTTVNKHLLLEKPLQALLLMFRIVLRLPALWLKFKNIRPDAMIINEGPRELLEFLPFLFFRKSKLLIVSQIETELESCLSRFVCSRADKIFAASKAVKTHFLSYGYPESRVQVVPLIVDVGNFLVADQSPNIRCELRLPEETKLIANISAIHPRKGIDDLIKAFALICEKNSDVHLLHIGGLARESQAENLYREMLISNIERNGLNNRVHFLDWREDLRLWLHQLDVVIMPTRREGLCRSAVECLWAGVPIVAYRIPSMAEVVVDRTTGFLIPFGDVLGLAEKTLEIIENQPLHDALQLKSKELWLNRYKPDICQAITKKAFEELWK